MMEARATTTLNENLLWQETVRLFIENDIEPHLSRWERDGHIPPSAFLQAGRRMILNHGAPANLGVCFHWERHAHLIKELIATGSQAVAVALTSHFVSLKAIARLSDKATAKRVTTDILSGRKTVSLALTERQAGSDLKNIQTRAVPTLAGYLIDGHKHMICRGSQADYLIVLAKDPEDLLSLFLVDSTCITTTQTLEKIGWDGLDLATVDIHGCIPNHHAIGHEGEGLGIVRDILEFERLNLAMIALHSAIHAFNLTFRYCRHREVGGRPLSAMGAVQQRLAALRGDIAVCETYVTQTARKIAEGIPCHLDVLFCKNLSVRTLKHVAEDCLQIHGGAACLADNPIQKFFRDAAILRIGGGTEEVLNMMIFKHLEMECANHIPLAANADLPDDSRNRAGEVRP